MKKFWVNS